MARERGHCLQDGQCECLGDRTLCAWWQTQEEREEWDFLHPRGPGGRLIKRERPHG